MFYLFFLLFIALCLGLVFSIFKKGRFRTGATIFRIAVVVLSVGVFTYYFVTKSINQFQKDSLTVQLINTLPFPLDFYIVQINNDKNSSEKYITRRSGSIRTDYYRIEYLDMKNSDQFWVAGFMGRKNMVYFSQHAVPNKNEDQIIEIRNYINQSQKLSEIAQIQIENLKLENIKTAIWITMDLLLLFLNLILLMKRSK